MSEPGLAEANERLLVRLGFDIHDGPLQQVYALAQDLRLLREQVLALIGGEHRDQMVGRFADVESQLGEIHRDLRDLAHSLEPRALLQQALPDAVGHELEVVGRRTGIATSLEVEGEFETLTPSQRIALLRVLQEALSNVRQHSGAAAVSVALRSGDEGVAMTVRDDGRGFEPESVAESGGDGGLGLTGMRERLRLLGGRLELASTDGGPTEVRAFLPRWTP